jgi:hypothetical protein
MSGCDCDTCEFINGIVKYAYKPHFKFKLQLPPAASTETASLSRIK